MRHTDDQRFGELRSLMNQTTLDAQARTTLWTLLQQAHSANKQEYEATWIPYLQGFKQHWQMPLAKIEDILTMPRANDVAPFATFELIITGETQPYEWREDIGMMLMSEHMRSVSVLRWVKNNFLTFHEDFLQSAHWNNLHTLQLNNQHIYVDIIEALTETPLIKQLHTLTLALNPLTLSGWEAFVQADCWHNLKHLDIAQADVDAHVVALLANTPSLSQLEHLNLCDNAIDTDGALELANSKHLHVTYLDIEEGNVGQEGLQALFSAPNMTKLNTLVAPWNNLGSCNEPFVLEADKLPALRHLNLSSNDICNNTMISILKTEWLTQLDTLNLEYNAFDDTAAAILAKANYLKGVDVLFDIDQLDPKSIKQLAESPYLPEDTTSWLKKRLENKSDRNL